jgi:iron complex transport system substrate-binding protein
VPLRFFAAVIAIFFSTLAASQSAETRLVTIGGALTETVYALGLQAQLVAVDSSSIYPDAATKLPNIGHERTLSIEGTLAQHPSLVIASSEAGPAGVIDQLRQVGVNVVIVKVEHGVEGAKRKVQAVADALGKSSEGKKLTDKIDSELVKLPAPKPMEQRRKVLFLYARGGGMLNVSGTGTAAHAVIEAAGGRNAVTEYANYKPLTAESAVKAAPDIILITSRGLQGMGGTEQLLKLPGLAETPAGRARRVVAIDDMKLLGFGPRTGEAVVELAAAFQK